MADGWCAMISRSTSVPLRSTPSFGMCGSAVTAAASTSASAAGILGSKSGVESSFELPGTDFALRAGSTVAIEEVK